MADPDFSLAGTPLMAWLGEEPHEATIKAAEQALALPGESFIVGVFHEPTLPVHNFGAQQRRAVRVWFSGLEQRPPGRMRLNVRTKLEPGTGQDVRVVVVTYDAKLPKRKASVVAVA